MLDRVNRGRELVVTDVAGRAVGYLHQAPHPTTPSTATTHPQSKTTVDQVSPRTPVCLSISLCMLVRMSMSVCKHVCVSYSERACVFVCACVRVCGRLCMHASSCTYVRLYIMGLR